MNPFFLYPFGWMIVVIIGFIAVRVAWYLLVEVPKGHARDEAICEKCYGKTMDDDVTESMEWCHCPQREDGSDKHKEKKICCEACPIPNDCPGRCEDCVEIR